MLKEPSTTHKRALYGRKRALYGPRRDMPTRVQPALHFVFCNGSLLSQHLPSPTKEPYMAEKEPYIHFVFCNVSLLSQHLPSDFMAGHWVDVTDAHVFVSCFCFMFLFHVFVSCLFHVFFYSTCRRSLWLGTGWM